MAQNLGGARLPKDRAIRAKGSSVSPTERYRYAIRRAEPWSSAGSSAGSRLGAFFDLTERVSDYKSVSLVKC